MANRQHGGRSPSGSRGPASRRAGRTVPINRSQAANRSLSGSREAWTPAQPGTPGYVEPEVRRWPHPLEDRTLSPAPAPEPALHYIRCALSYQNQLLADIKVLLEQLAPAAEPEKSGENLSKL